MLIIDALFITGISKSEANLNKKEKNYKLKE